MMTPFRAPLASAALLLVLVHSPSALAQVSSADQVCAPSDDPCIISTKIDTGPAAVLDFGDRELQIIGNGAIDADINNLTIRCGKLTIIKGGNVAAIELRGSTPFGSEGGVATIEVRRRCSLNNDIFCTKDMNCIRAVPFAGECSVGSGDVLIDGRISGSADDPGSLLVRAAGDVLINDAIVMNSFSFANDGGGIDFEAGGSLTVQAKLEVESGGDGTGGDICLSAAGDIFINDRLEAIGGDFDGGFVELAADGDVVITDDINCNAISGEGFGGEVSVTAGGDLMIVGGRASNRLNISTSGHESLESFGGDGGEQDYFASGNVTISEFVKLSSVGAPPDGFGEEVLINAGGDVLLEGDVDSKGVGSFAGGGSLSIFADGSVEITKTSKVELSGTRGGGDLGVDSGDLLTFAATVDATAGPDGPAGGADFDSSGDLIYAGSVITDGRQQALTINLITMRACNIEVASGSIVNNKAPNGRNQLIGREQIVIAAGATLRAEPLDGNILRYRNAARPPIVVGDVDPAPVLQVDAFLPSCAVCGNGVLNGIETCDDGNNVGGDGCSAECQNEGCIDMTPGWPLVPLCDDASGCTVDSCNIETSTCDHVEDCDDGVACTVDACGLDGECENAPDHVSCDDLLDCTMDFCCTGEAECGSTFGCSNLEDHAVCVDEDVCTSDVCDEIVGCKNDPNIAPCDDGIACTIDDTCSQGDCAGVPDCPVAELCNLISGQCEPDPDATTTTTTTTTTTSTTTTSTTTTTTTTTSTTTTTLPVLSVCGDGAVDVDEECDDGTASWETGQFCNANCEMLGCGDPNGDGATRANDALFTLRVVVGASQCDDCLCNVDGSGAISATDALRVLRVAVGLGTELLCPPCL